MEIKVFDGDLDDFSVLFYPGQASLMVKEAVSPEILGKKVIFVKNVVLPVVFICWWDSVGGDQLIEQQIPWGQSTLSESASFLEKTGSH